MKSTIDWKKLDEAKRGITPESFAKFSYGVGELNGEPVHVANYFRDGELVCQKTRTKDKEFKLLGDTKNIPLYGAWLWRESGKRITITEGELDAISLSQCWNHKWPVVSVPNGASAARKALAANIEWLEKFDEIVLCFDNDEPGNKAANECVSLFTPGKGKIARLPLKDANSMLTAGRQAELIDAIWSARAVRPDGVVSGLEVLELGDQAVTVGDSFPWQTMTNWTYGVRKNEMVAYGAGSGTGKTDTLKRIIGHLIVNHGRTVGTLLLEEPDLNLTLNTIAGQIDGALYHIPGVEVDEIKKETTRNLIASKLVMYKAGGAIDIESLLGIIRYMVVGCHCEHIFLDHVTYILDGATEEDQNTAMKHLMRSLNDLNKELPFTLHYVSHLRKSASGRKTHEEGGRVTLDDFVGGKAVAQYANFVFALERNQQDEDTVDQTVVRCLKDRYTGQGTGKTMVLQYDRSTGRKSAIEDSCVENTFEEMF